MRIPIMRLVYRIVAILYIDNTDLPIKIIENKMCKKLLPEFKDY